MKSVVWNGTVCDECLIHLGFDIDTTTPPVTIEDVREALALEE